MPEEGGASIKRHSLTALALAAALLLALCAGCGAETRGTGIGILTNVSAQSAASEAAEALAEENEAVTRLAAWPEAYMTETEAVISALAELAGDASLGALLLHEAVTGCAEALAEAETDGLYIAAARSLTATGDPISELAEQVDLLLALDPAGMGKLLAIQAKDMGATALIYYTLPRSAYDSGKIAHRAAAEDTCAELGLTFVPIDVPDDSYDAGTPSMTEFFAQSAAAEAAQYGADTAFYADNCAMQTPLLRAVLTLGGLYPQPCCPSLRHGLAEALALDDTLDDAALADAIRAELTARGMSGRVAGYRMEQAELELRVLMGAAKRHLAGETVDVAAVAELLGKIAQSESEVGRYADGGASYDNVLLYTVQSTVF